MFLSFEETFSLISFQSFQSEHTQNNKIIFLKHISEEITPNENYKSIKACLYLTKR